MDVLALVGAILAIIAILLGQTLEGGHVSSLINGPAFLIVIGGTVGAIMLQAPSDTLRRAVSLIKWVFFPPVDQNPQTLNKLLNWSNVARKSGILGLEDAVEMETDSFARQGLQMLVDGKGPGELRGALETAIIFSEQRDMDAAKLFESMGGYTPTIGILGAVMGLIHVMENLSEPARLGAGIATAFVATIYGVAAANLFLLPMANKIKAVAIRQAQQKEMLLEGLIGIAEGENPRNIEDRLRAYLKKA
jgi:chemotaxis protein MotA